MSRILFSLILASISISELTAQKLDYAVEFNHFLDNREYGGNSDRYANSQTMLGARLNGMIGAALDSTQGFMAGINYLYEYGDQANGNKPTINLFYHYNKNGVTGLLGSFPRKDLINYPLALLSDTLENYRPNIEGAYLAFSGKWGHQNLWCDWTGRQRSNVREAFLAGFSGKLIVTQTISFDHYFYMFHNALYAGNLEEDHIRDNGAFALLVTADLSSHTTLRELSFSAGSLGSYDRNRPDPKLHFSAGMFIQTHIQGRKFGLDASYYKGNRLTVVNGDGLYHSGDYARTDFSFIPIENKYVKSKASLCLHMVEGTLLNSQKLSLIVKLGAFCKNKTKFNTNYNQNETK